MRQPPRSRRRAPRSVPWLLALAVAGCAPGPPPPGPAADEATVARLAMTGGRDACGYPMLPSGTRRNCEVHGVPLQDDVIEVLRGLPYLAAPGFEEAESRSFPHAATLFFAGCEAGAPATVGVAYCPACREARHAWEQASAAAGRPHPYTEAQRRGRAGAAGAR